MQLGGALRQLWGALSRDSRLADDGAREALAGRNLTQRARSKQDAERQIADFRNRNRNWLDPSKH